MACLASLGEDVKVWDAANHSLQEQFSFDQDNVTDICWNHHGLVLANCCKDNSIKLRQFNGTKSVSSHSFSLPETHSICMEYDSSSRYLACGCNNGALHIYDTISLRAYKSFERHLFPITCVRWNWNDKYIALGSKHGEVFLYNVITGQASSPFKPVSSAAIHQLRYNPYRKASLVSADAKGVIALWDTNTRGHIHSFSSSHQAPASDLAFSPVNDYLMLSVGLDKRVIFYDMQNRQIINTIAADYPLTCVDMQDAGTIAVGTSRGKILFYDMRMSSTPMSTLNAHKSSMKRITFNKKDEVSVSSTATQPVPSDMSKHHKDEDSNQNNNDEWRVLSLNSDKTSSGFISPLKDNSNLSGVSESDLSAMRNSFINKLLGHGEDSAAGRNVSLGRHGSAKNSFISSNLQEPHAHSSLPNESGGVAGLFSPCHDDSSLAYNSNMSLSFLNKQDGSFITQMLGAAGSRDASIDQRAVLGEKSLSFKINPEVASHSPLKNKHDVSEADNVPSSLVRSKAETPPRFSSQRGVGASPSLRDVASTDQHDAVGSSPVATTTHHASSHRLNGSLTRSERKSSSRTIQNASSDHFDEDDIVSSPRSPRHRSHSHSKNKLNSESPDSVFADLRMMFKALKKENTVAFNAMKADIQADIKAALGQKSGAYTSGMESHLFGSSSEGAPLLGDILRQIVREELVDVKDAIHEEVFQSIVANHRMYYKLQLSMQQGFRQLAINPSLVEEIDRLNLEIKRLKTMY